MQENEGRPIAPGSNERAAGDSDAYVETLARALREHLARPKAESLVAVAGIHTAIRSLPATHVSPGRIACLLDVAQFFYISGQTVLGLEPASNAVLLAIQIKNGPLRRKALTVQGVLFADSGNLPAAVECYADALELARDQQDAVGECSVWNNLGGALIYGAQFSDAIQCLEQAIHVADADPRLTSVRQQALTNIALASLHCEAFDKGLTAARASIEALQKPGDANQLLTRVLCEANYSRLLLELNDLPRRGHVASRPSCSQRRRVHSGRSSRQPSPKGCTRCMRERST